MHWTRASRTDKGVHSLGTVSSAFVPCARGTAALLREPLRLPVVGWLQGRGPGRAVTPIAAASCDGMMTSGTGSRRAVTPVAAASCGGMMTSGTGSRQAVTPAAAASCDGMAAGKGPRRAVTPAFQGCPVMHIASIMYIHVTSVAMGVGQHC